MTGGPFAPEDAGRPAAEVEAEYLQELRHALTWREQVITGVRWVSIEIEGEAPESEVVLVFEPVAIPGRHYGLRWRFWPLDSLDIEGPLEWFSTNLEEEFGIGGLLNDALHGRPAVPPGDIHWIRAGTAGTPGGPESDR